MRKFSADDYVMVYRMYKNNFSIPEITKHFNCSTSVVYKIINTFELVEKKAPIKPYLLHRIDALRAAGKYFKCEAYIEKLIEDKTLNEEPRVNVTPEIDVVNKIEPISEDTTPTMNTVVALLRENNELLKQLIKLWS